MNKFNFRKKNGIVRFFDITYKKEVYSCAMAIDKESYDKRKKHLHDRFIPNAMKCDNVDPFYLEAGTDPIDLYVLNLHDMLCPKGDKKLIGFMSYRNLTDHMKNEDCKESACAFAIKHFDNFSVLPVVKIKLNAQKQDLNLKKMKINNI
jgi:hypothetical protein